MTESSKPFPLRRVGLTGGIATGKTTVCRMLEERGILILDADRIAQDLMHPGKPCYEPVVQAFGQEICDDAGRIDRQRLGSLVFREAAQLEKLNQIVHPVVKREILEQLSALESAEPSRKIIVDASVMIESGFHRDFQFLIVVTCQPGQQVERLKSRNGFSEAEARRRMESQLPLEEKNALADFVVDNSGTLENTRFQVDLLLDRLGWHPWETAFQTG